MLQQKNEQYKRELKEANSRKPEPPGRLRGRGKAKTVRFNVEEVAVEEAPPSPGVPKNPGRRNQPRKTQMIFQDVRQKLAKICQESQTISKNMDGVLKNLNGGVKGVL